MPGPRSAGWEQMGTAGKALRWMQGTEQGLAPGGGCHLGIPRVFRVRLPESRNFFLGWREQVLGWGMK